VVKASSGSVASQIVGFENVVETNPRFRSLLSERYALPLSISSLADIVPTVTEPEEALTTIIQKREDEIITMQKLSRKIVKDLKQITSEPTVSEVSSFSIIQGRSNIYARIGKLIQDSTDIIYIVTTVEDILRLYHTAIPEKIKICRKNGGQVRVLTYTKSDNLLPLIDRLDANETRIGKLPSKSRMIVEEGKQLVMSGSIKETMNLNDENDSILYTNSSEMINNMFSLCSHLWKKSKPIELIKAK